MFHETCKGKVEETYDENARDHVKSLLLNPVKHLVLQGADLIQDVNNLHQGSDLAKSVSETEFKQVVKREY